MHPCCNTLAHLEFPVLAAMMELTTADWWACD